MAAAPGFVNPATLTPEERTALLNGIDSNEVTEIRSRAYAYADAPNKNASRLNPERFPAAVEALNRSTEPAQLLVDHGRSTGYRVGTITKAAIELVAGVRWLAVEDRIVDKRAMADFIRGKLDRYSAGLTAPTRMVCSVCGTEWSQDGWYPEPQCPHTPGVDGAEVFLDADFAEVSFVVMPAVGGTQTYSEKEPKMEDPKPVPEPVVIVDPPALDYSAQLRDYAEQLARANEAATANANRYRDRVLDDAVRDGRILPADVGLYRATWDAMGEAHCLAMLSSRPSVALGGTAGNPSASPVSQGRPSGGPEAVLAVANKWYAEGVLRTKPTLERLEALGIIR
jgi:hypothetical protein